MNAERLRQLLHYDPASGIFRWIKCAGRYGRIPAGSIAGSPNKEGYRYITLDGVAYRACRLAFLYVTGELPRGQIDHRNRDVSDDRFDNLRDCTQSQNKSNSGFYRSNTSGHPGVRYDASKSRARYRAFITKNGKLHHIGWFLTLDEAIAARRDAAQKLHGEFAAEIKEAA